MQYAKFIILNSIFTSLLSIVILFTTPTFAATIEEKDGDIDNKTHIPIAQNNSDALSSIVNSQDYFVNIDRGNELFDEKRYEEAITYYDKALPIEPSSIEALQNKGVALYNSGKYEEAITYFDEVLTIDPNYTDAMEVKNASQSLLKYEAVTGRTAINDTPNGSHDKNLNNKEIIREFLTYAINSLYPETREKFTNTEYGVDMTLPRNWTGFEWKVVFPLAIVSPEGINVTSLLSSQISATVDSIVEEVNAGGNLYELAEQKIRDLNKPIINKLLQYFTDRTSSMAIYIYDKQFARNENSFNQNGTIPIDSQGSLYERHESESMNSGCFRKSLDQISLHDNILAEKATDQCFLGLDGNKKQNNIHYFILTPNAVVYIRYTYDPDKENEKSLQEFEEALKSLSIKGSLPINNQTIQQFLNG
jgi:tetratricopeptide (TPR) repeat protein